ncbi:MAG: hypothetical protein ACXWKQ_04790 [Reyranella sp.]
MSDQTAISSMPLYTWSASSRHWPRSASAGPEDYAADLRAAGFTEVATTDLTSDWAPYAAERLGAWRQNRTAYASVHGDGAYLAHEKFYAVIAQLYDSGSLGGIRLVARLPAAKDKI